MQKSLCEEREENVRLKANIADAQARTAASEQALTQQTQHLERRAEELNAQSVCSLPQTLCTHKHLLTACLLLS